VTIPVLLTNPQGYLRTVHHSDQPVQFWLVIDYGQIPFWPVFLASGPGIAPYKTGVKV